MWEDREKLKKLAKEKASRLGFSEKFEKSVSGFQIRIYSSNIRSAGHKSTDLSRHIRVLAYNLGRSCRGYLGTLRVLSLEKFGCESDLS